MPTYKNSLKAPEYVENTILDENGNIVGTLRLKPSTVLWKPNGAQKWYAVSLEKFGHWITSGDSGFKRTAN